MVTEKVMDYTRTENGKVSGEMVYEYHSPTHWASSGLCRISVAFWNGKATVLFNYGAGGTNSGHTAIDIAEAMSEAFGMAKQRLMVLAALGYTVE